MKSILFGRNHLFQCQWILSPASNKSIVKLRFDLELFLSFQKAESKGLEEDGSVRALDSMRSTPIKKYFILVICQKHYSVIL